MKDFADVNNTFEITEVYTINAQHLGLLTREEECRKVKKTRFLRKEGILNKFLEYVVKVTNKTENVNRTK